MGLAFNLFCVSYAPDEGIGQNRTEVFSLTEIRVGDFRLVYMYLYYFESAIRVHLSSGNLTVYDYDSKVDAFYKQVLTMSSV